MSSKSPIWVPFVLVVLLVPVAALATDLEAAAIAFSDLIKKEAGPLARQEAEFQLGASLQKLGLQNAATEQLKAVAKKGAKHLFFGKAVQSLFEILSDDEAELLLADLLPIFESAPKDWKLVRSEDLQKIWFLLAKRQFKAANYAESIQLAARVSSGHPNWSKAQYLLGLNAVKLNQAKKRNYFLRIADEKNEVGNLARLALARLDYEEGYLLAEDDPNRQKLLGRAAQLYESIPRFSEQWAQSLLERGWAYTASGDHGRALGAVYSFHHPYFSTGIYPEVPIIRAINYWYNCQWDRVDQQKALPSLNRTKVGRHKTLASLLAQSERELVRITQLKRLQSSTLGKQLTEFLDGFKAALGLALERWQDREARRLQEEIEDALTRMSIIALETKTAQAEWLDLGREIEGRVRKKLDRPFVPNDQNEFWWVRGQERWIDELGYYRFTIKSECYD